MAWTQQRMFTTSLICVITLTACSTVPVTGDSDEASAPAHMNDGPPPPPDKPVRDDLPKCHGIKPCMDSFHQHHRVLSDAVEVVALAAMVVGFRAALKAFTHSAPERDSGPHSCEVGGNCPAPNPACLAYIQQPTYVQWETPRPSGC